MVYFSLNNQNLGIFTTESCLHSALHWVQLQCCRRLKPKRWEQGGPGVILQLNLALLLLNLSRYFYTFYKPLYVKHQFLAHWNLPWQNQMALTDKFFFTNRKKKNLNVSYWGFSHCYPVNQYQLIRPLSAWQWFVGGLVPRALSIAKPKHQSGAALCLQNRSITFVPKTFKKMIFRPSAGPIPGGDFTQHDLGWQDWSFKASQTSLA